MKKLLFSLVVLMPLVGCTQPLFTFCTADKSQCFDSNTLTEDKDRSCVSSDDSRICGDYTIHRNFTPAPSEKK